MIQLMIIGTFLMAGNDQADDAVVLGAGIIRREPSYTLAKRLDYAAKYLEDNPSGMLITSGGKSDGQLASEAEVMMWYLEKKGISADRIILEEKSTNTLENIKYSMNQLNQRNDTKVTEIVIITSDYHLLRAQMIARRLGLNAYGIPAQSPPDLYWHYSIRESVAIFKSMLLDW
ncbi:YdcF family protein [Tindallia californiensis]|nr:YdcF family protein [Tindallia californiensis]